jgi:hypothetical protein
LIHQLLSGNANSDEGLFEVKTFTAHLVPCYAHNMLFCFACFGEDTILLMHICYNHRADESLTWLRNFNL